MLVDVRYQEGLLLGQMGAVGFDLQLSASLEVLTSDIIKTSAIEGETLDREQVRSSLASKLGVDIGGLKPVDRHVEGILEVMLDATQNYDQPLTQERLFSWHRALFPTGWSGLRQITTGVWRPLEAGPMRVVSGPIGRERVHFEAPSADRLPHEMQQFLKWLAEEEGLDLILKSALAHLWFVTIHPFEDGNGRIARAIADMLLSHADGTPQRFYSMSTQIERERKTYYQTLEQTQRGGLDITAWMCWYLGCLERAILSGDKIFEKTIFMVQYLQKAAEQPLNERQKQVLYNLLKGFQGKLTTSKYAKLAKCSQDTALRDIHHLIEVGLLQQNSGGGRSTSYSLTEE